VTQPNFALDSDFVRDFLRLEYLGPYRKKAHKMK